MIQPFVRILQENPPRDIVRHILVSIYRILKVSVVLSRHA